MKKTIDYFVEFDKLKKERKVPANSNREFVHPDNLLLPPTKISDDNYDYGNVIYNKLLNKSGQYPIWLTMLPKNPELPNSEYKYYLNAIASVLGNKLKFTKF